MSMKVGAMSSMSEVSMKQPGKKRTLDLWWQ
jgi:hypothetical protein